MYKSNPVYMLFLAVIFSLIFSCSKTNEVFDAQGGLLPTNYININDSSFSPALLEVANGSSITFLNRSDIVHTIISADSTTIVTTTIEADSSFYVKPDTLSGSVPVYIYYHCREHPTATGTIILRP